MQALDGNDKCIELLERCLEHARKNPTTYVGVLMCDHPNLIRLETTGTSDMEDQLPAVLDRFKSSIVPRVSNRSKMPTPDPTLGPDYVCYNIAGMPVSYDFVPWVINQEMRRQRLKAPPPLKVGFWFGQDGESGLETEYRSTMFTHVVQPILNLIGAVEDKRAVLGLCDQDSKEFAPFRTLVQAARAGESVPKLKARPQVIEQVRKWLDGRRPITITLREAEHWRHRNSNRVAWVAFANDLKKEGKHVIFVRDTARANEPIEGQETCPLASVNLEVRVALYEEAEANLFISNGPASLAWFGTRPYLQFVSLDEDGAFAAGTSRWWEEYCDMKPGDNYPWAAELYQRLIWDLDTYQNIHKAWKELDDAIPTTVRRQGTQSRGCKDQPRVSAAPAMAGAGAA